MPSRWVVQSNGRKGIATFTEERIAVEGKTRRVDSQEPWLLSSGNQHDHVLYLNHLQADGFPMALKIPEGIHSLPA